MQYTLPQHSQRRGPGKPHGMQYGEKMTKIYIVEDNPVDLKITTRAVEGIGFSVSGHAFSGEDALKQIPAAPPDLVLMDILLRGEMDGIETADRILEKCDIPVIFLTAHSEIDLVVRASASRSFGYVLKPFDINALQAMIRMALSRHRLAQTLKERETELRSHREKLEKLVEQRTEELRIANHRLQKERDTAQKYLDIAGVILLVLDRQGRIRLINKKGCRILETRVEDMIGLPWLETFISPDSRSEFRDIFHQMIAKTPDSHSYFENYIVSAKGEKRLIAWQSIPLRDAEKGICGVLSSGEDISERRHTENLLAKQQREQKQLISDLEKALAEVKTLRGLIPICASCKKIRDDKGYWQQVEKYISERSDIQFSHDMCPDCIRKMYPDIAEEILSYPGLESQNP